MGVQNIQDREREVLALIAEMEAEGEDTTQIRQQLAQAKQQAASRQGGVPPATGVNQSPLPATPVPPTSGFLQPPPKADPATGQIDSGVAPQPEEPVQKQGFMRGLMQGLGSTKHPEDENPTIPNRLAMGLGHFIKGMGEEDTDFEGERERLLNIQKEMDRQAIMAGTPKGQLAQLDLERRQRGANRVAPESFTVEDDGSVTKDFGEGGQKQDGGFLPGAEDKSGQQDFSQFVDEKPLFANFDRASEINEAEYRKHEQQGTLQNFNSKSVGGVKYNKIIKTIDKEGNELVEYVMSPQSKANIERQKEKAKGEAKAFVKRQEAAMEQMTKFGKVAGSATFLSDLYAEILKEGSGGDIVKLMKSRVGTAIGGAYGEQYAQFAQFEGMKAEMALMLMPILTGSTRIIKSIFDHLLKTLPDGTESALTARGKLRQTVRNMFLLSKVMNRMGVKNEHIEQGSEAQLEAIGSQAVAGASNMFFQLTGAEENELRTILDEVTWKLDQEIDPEKLAEANEKEFRMDRKKRNESGRIEGTGRLQIDENGNKRLMFEDGSTIDL